MPSFVIIQGKKKSERKEIIKKKSEQKEIITNSMKCLKMDVIDEHLALEL